MEQYKGTPCNRLAASLVEELVAQVNVYLSEGAFPFAEGFEMLIDVLPLGVPGIGLLLEPCEKTAFLLLSVKEVVAFVHDTLIASAS